MPFNTFHLAKHYTPIQQQIFDNRKGIDTLYKEYGELVNECLFLSRLIEKLKLLLNSDNKYDKNLLSIVSQLIEFELSQFRPYDLVPIYEGQNDEGQNFFRGEIIYCSDNALVLKVISNQFPTWKILLIVVARITSTILPNVELQTHFEFSAVTLWKYS